MDPLDAKCMIENLNLENFRRGLCGLLGRSDKHSVEGKNFQWLHCSKTKELLSHVSISITFASNTEIAKYADSIIYLRLILVALYTECATKEATVDSLRQLFS